MKLVHANAFDGVCSLVRDEAEAARLARVRVAHYHAVDHLTEHACTRDAHTKHAHVSVISVFGRGGGEGGEEGGDQGVSEDDEQEAEIGNEEQRSENAEEEQEVDIEQEQGVEIEQEERARDS